MFISRLMGLQPVTGGALQPAFDDITFPSLHALVENFWLQVKTKTDRLMVEIHVTILCLFLFATLTVGMCEFCTLNIITAKFRTIRHNDVTEITDV